jgi:hypothetical protein
MITAPPCNFPRDVRRSSGTSGGFGSRYASTARRSDGLSGTACRVQACAQRPREFGSAGRHSPRKPLTLQQPVPANSIQRRPRSFRERRGSACGFGLCHPRTAGRARLAVPVVSRPLSRSRARSRFGPRAAPRIPRGHAGAPRVQTARSAHRATPGATPTHRRQQGTRREVRRA